MSRATRIMLIEKHFDITPRFSFTHRGIKEAGIFIREIGGIEQMYETWPPWFNPTVLGIIHRANNFWERLKNNE